MNEMFMLYANCRPVRGARRSLLCDLGRNSAHLIPNALFEILTTYRGHTVSDLKALYGEGSDSIIDEYFDFLLQEDYGFFCEEPGLFPDLGSAWDRPGKLTNAIIDIDQESGHDWAGLIDQLDNLGCEALQIRSYSALSIEALDKIMVSCSQRRLRHVDLVVRWHPTLDVDNLSRFVHAHQVISRVVIHSSPTTRRERINPFHVLVLFVTQEACVSTCGEVSTVFFSFSQDHFLEAQHFNTCLNRKISICANGEIRGCPALGSSVGHATTTKIADALNDPGLVKLTTISKDQVSVCRDCEFRYVCTDCRALVENPVDLYSKPRKCEYDPYTAKWSNNGRIASEVVRRSSGGEERGR